MKKTLLGAIALATFSTTFLPAQSTGTGTQPTTAQIVANRVARLTALLTLTTAQQTQATTIFTTEETALSTIRTSLQTAHSTLETAIKADDQTGIATQSTQIGTLTTQQVLAQAKADAAFYAILTSDQQTKYNTLQLVGLGGPGGGPGGPGGPRF
jgi:Spy/CpxP family protein refolding chaperone